ncbi:MAG TPA: hypothetical protein PKA88_31435 [Polyangiaceae bacterium]|nr:hypothetical protein [Polyangiaceae bacterium]
MICNLERMALAAFLAMTLAGHNGDPVRALQSASDGDSSSAEATYRIPNRTYVQNDTVTIEDRKFTVHKYAAFTPLVSLLEPATTTGKFLGREVRYVTYYLTVKAEGITAFRRSGMQPLDAAGRETITIDGRFDFVPCGDGAIVPLKIEAQIGPGRVATDWSALTSGHDLDFAASLVAAR